MTRLARAHGGAIPESLDKVRDFLIAAAAHIHEVLEMAPGLNEPTREPDLEILAMLHRGLRES